MANGAAGLSLVGVGNQPQTKAAVPSSSGPTVDASPTTAPVTDGLVESVAPERTAAPNVPEPLEGLLSPTQRSILQSAAQTVRRAGSTAAQRAASFADTAKNLWTPTVELAKLELKALVTVGEEEQAALQKQEQPYKDRLMTLLTEEH